VLRAAERGRVRPAGVTVAVAIVVATIALGAIACVAIGGSTWSAAEAAGVAGAGAAPAAPTAPAPTADAYRVGGIADVELFPGTEIGARARLDALNASGGIHGRSVEFLGVSDDHRDPSVTRAEVRRLVREVGVDAIVPVVTSRFTADGSRGTGRVPAFGWGIAGGFCANRWAFAITGCLAPLLPRRVPGIWGDLVASVLRTRGVRHPTAAIVVDAAAVPRSLDELRAMVEAAGIRVTYAQAVLDSGEHAADVADAVATEVLVASRRPPSAVFAVAGFGAVGALQDALRARGFGGVMTNLVQYSPLLVAAANGAYVLTQFATPESAPDNPAMREIVRQIASLTSDAVTPSMLAGWLAADLWVRAVERAGRGASPQQVARAASRLRFQVPRTVGPTVFPRAFAQPTSCGQLVTSDGVAFGVAVPYRCSRYVRVP